MAQRALADRNGRPYVLLKELKAGQRVELDDGFTCGGPRVEEIKADEKGHLYFECNDGRHYVSGQLEHGSLIGVYAATNGHEHS